MAHDQLWNIIPTPKNVNSAKNDRLPSLETYFEAFSTLQYKAVQFYVKKGNQKLPEDYIYLFRENVHEMSLETFQDVLRKQITPQWQTAQNLGFSYPFIYVEK